ncbi:MAG: hypothetical protein VB034_02380 [Eubacteriales bacterium]|nr:hypothetical protein [Eubacteriales bacterium]
MEREQGLAISLATTAAALAEALTERDQYKSALDWKDKKCDALMTELQKVRADLAAANRELEKNRTAQQAAGSDPKGA